MIAWYPCFIDIEASGFGPESWPVSVAWCDRSGAITTLLVRPQPAWTHWDSASERIHGIDRARLEAEGRAPAEIAELLEAEFQGRPAYSDAPEFDAGWLAALYHGLGRPLPFRLEHADDLLVGAMLRPGELLWQAQARLDRARADLRTTASDRHDAGYDVGFLVALWRRALGETVKMNHGLGPVPDVTATGSFKRRRG